MDARDFSLRLKKIKAEALAMKQAHRYGLGRADFPSELVEITPSTSGELYVRLIIVFRGTTDNLPFIQKWTDAVGWRASGNTFDGHTYREVFSYSAISGRVLKILVVATRAIESAELEFVE